MRKKVLVVDDNASNLMLEKDLLEVAGFEVFVAENAASGIDITRKEKPDVIVMDVRLPDMRGTEAARVLRQDKETCDIPIVFVTASVMAEGMEEIRNIPNSGFIGKPINTRTFVEDIIKFIRETPIPIA
jgi:CheY-like chemotaxis protein